jgi:hypothetical protein
MCTVSVVPRIQGFRLVCNRDERTSRSGALTPQRQAAGFHGAVFPIDPEGGGTWIGLNDRGLALALLNRTGTPRTASFAPPSRSRGLIIPPLLAHDHLVDAIWAATALDLRVFRPFRLVAVHAGLVGVVTWDGRDATVEGAALTQPLLFTSSSLGDALVEGPRRRLFTRLVLGARDSWLDGQRRFHRHQWSDRPEISVQMARPGARTVSRTVIDVTAAAPSLAYEPLGTLAEAA